MTVQVDLTKRMPRGAIPSPRHALAAAMPHIPDPTIAAPGCFLMWPSQMSFWGNADYGDCVTAEEAFAKATASPQTYIPDNYAVAWATANGFLQGASLTSVLLRMQTSGLPFDGSTYDDGSFNSVNWTHRASLVSAIYSYGPVKLGVASDTFETNDNGKVTPGKSGWAMYNYPDNQVEDHCVSLCGYGELMDLVHLFWKRGISVQIPEGMPLGMCYAMFTWNSIGIIDEQSLLNMTHEAWIRTPVTRTNSDTVFLTSQISAGIWGFNPITMAFPTQISTTVDLGFRSAVQVGNTLYLTAQGSEGIWTFDLNSKAKPTQIASTRTLGFRGIALSKNALYLTTQGNDGIWTYDLSLKDKPIKISTTAGHGFRGLVQEGNLLYLTTQGADGIWTFDLTSEKEPKQIRTTAGYGFLEIIKVGGTLYLTSQGRNGIWTFDLATEAAPVQIPSTVNLGFQGMAQDGTSLYLTTQGSHGIWIFDMVTKAVPTQIPSTAPFGFNDLIIT